MGPNPSKYLKADDSGTSENAVNTAPVAAPRIENSTAVSMLRFYMDENKKILQSMEQIEVVDEKSSLQLSLTKQNIAGLINGLRFALELMEREESMKPAPSAQPSPTIPPATVDTTPVIPTDSEWIQVPQRRRSPKPNPKETSVKPATQLPMQSIRKPPAYKQVLLKEKTEALKRLQTQKPTPEMKRQVIYEPTDPEKRREHISNICFLREFNSSFLKQHGIERSIEMLSRLPRGGFRLQLTRQAFTTLQEKQFPGIRMLSYGEWKYWNANTMKPTKRSVVMNPIYGDITAELLKEALAEPSTQLGITTEDLEKQFHGMERMKYKERQTGILRESNSIRVFVDEQLFQTLVTRQAFFLGHQSVYVRAYTPPQYRCFNCNQIGFHRANECRQPSRPTMSWADQMETENPGNSNKRNHE
eukprot:g5162.t1